MGDVVAISLLIPGADVSVSGRIVRVSMSTGVKCYDALEIEELPVDENSKLRFAPLISVPPDAGRAVVLVRCDMPFEGDFTPRALRLVKQGAHYVTTLKQGVRLPGDDEETELQCDMAYVLRETSKGAVLLGVLSASVE